MKSHLFSYWPGARDITSVLGGIRRRTRLVGYTKLTLGVLSLLLILIVLLLPQRGSDRAGVRIAFTAIETTDKEQPRMEKPSYQGIDNKGQPYTVSAEAATQIQDNVVELKNMSADITMNGNRWLALTADRGLLKVAEKQMTLTGHVALFHDQGYEMHGDNILVNLQNSTADSNDPVNGQGPAGVLTAKGFFVAKEGGTLHFKGPVTLKVYPGAK